MKLNYTRTFFMGLAFLSICAFWQLYDNVIPLILKNTFGLKETVTGTVMALDNVLAIFLLPIFGALSDKTNTSLGKRTPFIIIGTLISVIFMIILPVADKGNNFILFVGALFILLIGMGSYRSPAVALMPDLTPKPLRSKANAIINLMGAAGGIYTLIMIKLLVNNEVRPDYLPVYISIGLLMVTAVIVLVLTIREKKLLSEMALSDSDNIEKIEELDNDENQDLNADVKKSLILLLLSIFLWFTAYNAVTTAFSRYAGEVWGLHGGSYANNLLVATGAAIISYIPIGIISSRIGRKKTILTGIILITISYIAGSLFTNYSPLINIVFALTGIGWASINVNSYPMVVEMSKGADVGKYTGLYYTFSMAAQTVTPILSGFFLEHISYRTLFPYAVVFSVMSFSTMFFVKHGDVKPIKKTVLENFDIDD
ncbi:Na+/melibiose symporter-like transporter [Mobilisporobacter senegalensis]|uniref:Na+/melibiose symporter-like transporter n=1 Tax=Mobilisporobacter senegalensis TaxID=1329262 RepID=A0A3N1XMT8_9FIRM|nr:MFS transporter [Mobilisporobacter senegalensis]ROR26402.1 Na+/melibiose symporter-like transporter [Mobilisporobacter senegalensis]